MVLCFPLSPGTYVTPCPTQGTGLGQAALAPKPHPPFLSLVVAVATPCSGDPKQTPSHCLRRVRSQTETGRGKGADPGKNRGDGAADTWGMSTVGLVQAAEG